MREPWSRSIECDDLIGRVRAFRVTLDEKHNIVLTAPPGESAVLPPRNVEAVKQALTDAQVESVHRRKTW